MIEYESFIEYCDGSRIEVDIPRGFHFKEGEVDKGYVIEDNNHNQFLRIPAGYTSDGMYFRGFWVSRYEVSKGENGKICSVPGKYPLTEVDYETATRLAKKFGGTLISKEEYNRICMWMVETKAATFEEVFLSIGSKRGNFSDPFIVEKTGANPLWMINRLDNFFGNCYIWTTEKSDISDQDRIVRGGAGTNEIHSASKRIWLHPEEKGKNVTFRVVLHDKKDN